MFIDVSFISFFFSWLLQNSLDADSQLFFFYSICFFQRRPLTFVSFHFLDGLFKRMKNSVRVLFYISCLLLTEHLLMFRYFSFFRQPNFRVFGQGYLNGCGFFNNLYFFANEMIINCFFFFLFVSNRISGYLNV